MALTTASMPCFTTKMSVDKRQLHRDASRQLCILAERHWPAAEGRRKGAAGGRLRGLLLWENIDEKISLKYRLDRSFILFNAFMADSKTSAGDGQYINHQPNSATRKQFRQILVCVHSLNFTIHPLHTKKAQSELLYTNNVKIYRGRLD